MKIKVDENIPFRLVAALRDVGHDVHTVAEEGLTSRPDAEVWAAAGREGCFLITQDLDFSDIRQFNRARIPDCSWFACASQEQLRWPRE